MSAGPNHLPVTEFTHGDRSSSSSIKIQLPDGTVQSHPADKTPLDIAFGISEGLSRAVIAAEVNGKVVDAARPLRELVDDGGDEPVALKLLTSRTEKPWTCCDTRQRT